MLSLELPEDVDLAEGNLVALDRAILGMEGAHIAARSRLLSGNCSPAFFAKGDFGRISKGFKNEKTISSSTDSFCGSF
jgi:hypothetical protein